MAALNSQAANASKQNDNEVSHLMKAATGIKDIDLNFVQQIQRKLSLKNVARNGQVTFFVGQSKTSIDLPTEETSLAVSDSDAPVKVMLSAQSDGIIGKFTMFKVHFSIVYHFQ